MQENRRVALKASNITSKTIGKQPQNTDFRKIFIRGTEHYKRTNENKYTIHNTAYYKRRLNTLTTLTWYFGMNVNFSSDEQQAQWFLDEESSQNRNSLYLFPKYRF